MKEFEYKGIVVSGFLAVCAAIVVPVAAIAILASGEYNEFLTVLFGVLFGVLEIVILSGMFIQEPNQSRVLTFFGKYKGTCRRVGFSWINPLMKSRNLSLRLRNMDVAPIKVNDKVGNPILIGMVLVWKIKDTYKAVFDIDSQSLGSASINYALDNFVRIQSDAALREVAGHFAYDETGTPAEGSSELTLRSGNAEISEMLERKLNERLAMAGIEIIEARINYLAYAPEIAAVMLRRQQASAIIAAREQIVEGAVSMVEMALNRLERDNVVEMTADRRARMVSNLLVVLCSEDSTQPVISAEGE